MRRNAHPAEAGRPAGAFGPAIAARAFWWARAVTGLMYVGWAVDNSDRAPDLIAQIEDATARLAAIWP